MTHPALLATADAPRVRRTSRRCRLDLRAIPAPSAPAQPTKRGFGRGVLVRIGVSIVALELLVAGGLRLGVGAPEERPATAAAASIAPRAAARSLSRFEVPTARPAIAVARREEAERVADADLAPAHLGQRPVGFGTF